MLSSCAVGLNRFLVWFLLMGITSSNLEFEAVAFTEVLLLYEKCKCYRGFFDLTFQFNSQSRKKSKLQRNNNIGEIRLLTRNFRYTSMLIARFTDDVVSII